MKKYFLNKDVKVFYVTAKSFPEGIPEAHEKLHTLVPYSNNRRYYGISYPINGVIVYKAAAEELHDGEAEKFKCETFVLKSGNYISEIVTDYANDLQRVNKIFDEFIHRPDIDPNGCCVERYVNEKDVQCMVRLKK